MLRDRPENPLDVRTPSTNITVPHTVGKSLVSVSMKKDLLRSGPDKQVCEMGSIYMVPPYKFLSYRYCLTIRCNAFVGLRCLLRV